MTSVKVHKHAFEGLRGPEEQKFGKSRGGANTKIHTLIYGVGRILRVLGTSGNRHDLIGAFELVDGFSGRTILADKAYDSNEFRAFLAECGVEGCIPPKANRTEPEPFQPGHYKHRRNVENFFQRINEKRAIFTRYENWLLNIFISSP